MLKLLLLLRLLLALLILLLPGLFLLLFAGLGRLGLLGALLLLLLFTGLALLVLLRTLLRLLLACLILLLPGLVLLLLAGLPLLILLGALLKLLLLLRLLLALLILLLLASLLLFALLLLLARQIHLLALLQRPLGLFCRGALGGGARFRINRRGRIDRKRHGGVFLGLLTHRALPQCVFAWLAQHVWPTLLLACQIRLLALLIALCLVLLPVLLQLLLLAAGSLLGVDCAAVWRRARKTARRCGGRRRQSRRLGARLTWRRVGQCGRHRHGRLRFAVAAVAIGPPGALGIGRVRLDSGRVLRLLAPLARSFARPALTKFIAPFFAPFLPAVFAAPGLSGLAGHHRPCHYGGGRQCGRCNGPWQVTQHGALRYGVAV